MRLPPWAIEAIRNGVADVARKASDAETVAKVRQQAAELLRDLPENASRGIDAIVRTATETAKGAIDTGRESVMRWTERQADVAVGCLNASGILFSEHGTGIAVSDPVLELGTDVLRGNCLEDQIDDRMHRSLSKLLDVDGRQLLVAGNLDAAIASVSALTGDRTLVMHRSQAIRLPSGTPLPDAFGGRTLQECGGVQGIEPGDFDGIDGACVILADDGSRPIETIDFGDRDVWTVAILPLGTLNESLPGIPNAKQLLQDGVDLVVLPAGPLTGGCSAGILAGKRELIEQLRNSPVWKAHAASSGITAMTLASMTAELPTPFGKLVETAEDNLRSRTERLAIRLTAEESITTCQITDQPASLVRHGRWQYPSRQLRLRHQSLVAEKWAKQLREQDPAVIATTDDQDLVIDLRWVPASSDSDLAEALGDGVSAAEILADAMGSPSRDEAKDSKPAGANPARSEQGVDVSTGSPQTTNTASQESASAESDDSGSDTPSAP